MNETKFLFGFIIDKCNKISYNIRTGIEFGLDTKKQDEYLTNVEKINSELGYLYTLVEMLKDLGIKMDPCVSEIKKDNIMKYVEYAKKAGYIKEDV